MQKLGANLFASVTVTFLATLLVSTGASGESHSSTGSKSGLVVDEIIVTVRKTNESLQVVLIAVTVIDSTFIERTGVYSLQDVTEVDPSFILDGGFAPQDTRVIIRGLAPPRGRQNIAFLQDGIDISSEALTTAGGSLLTNPRLFDLERIEVVKGIGEAHRYGSPITGGFSPEQVGRAALRRARSESLCSLPHSPNNTCPAPETPR